MSFCALTSTATHATPSGRSGWCTEISSSLFPPRETLEFHQAVRNSAPSAARSPWRHHLPTRPMLMHALVGGMSDGSGATAMLFPPILVPTSRGRWRHRASPPAGAMSNNSSRGVTMSIPLSRRNRECATARDHQSPGRRNEPTKHGSPRRRKTGSSPSSRSSECDRHLCDNFAFLDERPLQTPTARPVNAGEVLAALHRRTVDLESRPGPDLELFSASSRTSHRRTEIRRVRRLGRAGLTGR